MAENCGQEKDVRPTSPLEEDVNNWLDSPLPCSYYGLLCLCQVNTACMVNALTAKDLLYHYLHGCKNLQKLQGREKLGCGNAGRGVYARTKRTGRLRNAVI